MPPRGLDDVPLGQPLQRIFAVCTGQVELRFMTSVADHVT